MKRLRPLSVVIVFMTYLPLVALAVIAGVIFGWRLPAAFAVVAGLLIARARRPPVRRGRVKAAAEFVGFALLGGVIGGLALGGLGAIFGFVIGFSLRLAEVPITGVRSSHVRSGKRQGRTH